MTRLYPVLAFGWLHAGCSEQPQAPTITGSVELNLAPRSSAVGRQALLVRSSLAMGESDATLHETLLRLHEVELEIFAVSVESALRAYRLATPLERTGRKQDLEDALLVPLLKMRSALLIDPEIEEAQRIAGIPQVAHRLLQHHSNEALASSLSLDLNLEALRHELEQAPQLAVRGELHTLESRLVAYARELYTFQLRRLQALPRILEHLDERHRLELVLGPAVSGWLGVPPDNRRQP